MRKAGVRAAAESLSAEDGEVGMELLHEIYAEMVGKGFFGRTTDVVVTDDYEAQEQDRILVTTGDAVSVTLAATVTDADTGEVRPPKDYSLIIVADALSDGHQSYVYDALYGTWAPLTGLTLDSYAPLSHKFPAGLRGMVAIKRAAEEGLPVSPVHAREAAMMNLALASRYDSAAEPVSNTYF